MTNRSKEYPACFGIIDNVFPKGEGDVRTTPESCFPCFCKTECLRKAMEGYDGLKIREENIDRAYESGMIGFVERWSRKKFIQTRLKGKKD